MISIYRYINGISLNGREYLLNEENEVLLFPSRDKAFKFLAKCYYELAETKDEEELEEYGLFFEREGEADE